MFTRACRWGRLRAGGKGDSVDSTWTTQHLGTLPDAHWHVYIATEVTWHPLGRVPTSIHHHPASRDRRRSHPLQPLHVPRSLTTVVQSLYSSTAALQPLQPLQPLQQLYSLYSSTTLYSLQPLQSPSALGVLAVAGVGVRRRRECVCVVLRRSCPVRPA